MGMLPSLISCIPPPSIVLLLGVILYKIDAVSAFQTSFDPFPIFRTEKTPSAPTSSFPDKKARYLGLHQYYPGSWGGQERNKTST